MSIKTEGLCENITVSAIDRGIGKCYNLNYVYDFFNRS